MMPPHDPLVPALADQTCPYCAQEVGKDFTFCPQCGHPLEHQAEDKRKLTTHYNQTIELSRSYALCPVCGMRVFPPR